jgi:hypothetical protein
MAKPKTRRLKEKLTFGTLLFPSPAIVLDQDVTRTYSPDRSVVSTILPPMTVELQKPNDGLSRVSVATFEVPATATAAGRGVTYRASIRGTVTKSPGARAYALLSLGGTVRTIDLPYGRDVKVRDIATTVEAAGRMTITPGASLPPATMTLVLIAERRTPDAIVFCQLDTVDVTGTSH